MVSAVGISVIDHIMTIEGFKTCEGSFHCEEYFVEGGGMAATALCAASRLGSDTRLFSRIGDDINGKLILEGLAKYGVDTSGVVCVTGKNSTVSFVLVDTLSGEKQFFSEWIKAAYDDEMSLDTELLDGSSVVLVDGHWTEGALQAVKWAQQRKVPVVADFKRMYRKLDSLFPYIDYFIVPLFFAREITGKEYIEDILPSLVSMQNGIPVVTMGNEGGAYLIDGNIRQYQSFPVDCVDSTGAGDAFHGAFCHFLASGSDIGHCLDYASAVGALNCRSLGGRNSLPDIRDTIKFLNDNGIDLTIA